MQSLRGTAGLFVVIAVAALFVGGASQVRAVSFDELRQQLEERRAERRAAMEERLKEIRGESPTPTPSDTGSEQEDESEQEQDTACDCSASLGLGKPTVQWANGMLEIVPQFDVSIRVRGDGEKDPWALSLGYDGEVEGQAFAGAKQFGAQCFDGRHRYSGISGEPVRVSTLLRSMFGVDAEKEVPLRLRAALAGCDSDSENKQAIIEIEEFGNLDVKSWRTAR